MASPSIETMKMSPPVPTPRIHDVLSGRGRKINLHEGNVQHRTWVAQRENDYNLAPNAAEKTLVVRQVVDVVQNQNPPGRFLIKEGPSGWTELGDDQAMAKTRQALREGTPQIRAGLKVRKCRPLRLKSECQGEDVASRRSSDKPKAVAELPADRHAARDAEEEEEEGAEQERKKRPRVDFNGQQTAHPTVETLPARVLAPTMAQLVPNRAQLAPTRAGHQPVPTRAQLVPLLPRVIVSSPPSDVTSSSAVGATRIESAAVAAQQRMDLLSISLRIDSMTKEMQTWAQMVRCAEGETKHMLVQRMRALSHEIEIECRKLDEVSRGMPPSWASHPR
jgi:hypothetical protein